MICKKHGELKKDDIKSGKYRNKNYRKCRLCERDRARDYTKRVNADPEKRKHRLDKDKNYWKENKDAITKRRQQPEVLEKRRKWHKENAGRYAEGYKLKQQKYKQELHDAYVKKIIQNGNKDLKFNEIPPAMVELKRAVMSLKRGIKLISNNNKRKNNEY